MCGKDLLNLLLLLSTKEGNISIDLHNIINITFPISSRAIESLSHNGESVTMSLRTAGLDRSLVEYRAFSLLVQYIL